MSPDVLSVKIAQAIASLWDLHKAGEFLRYLGDTFGVTEQQRPSFRCIYIAETEEGDMKSGPSGALVKHWWQVDDNGTQEISVPKMDWDDSPFFATPKVLFYVEGDSVALLERYGPRKMYRKRGKLAVNDSAVRIESVEVIN